MADDVKTEEQVKLTVKEPVCDRFEIIRHIADGSYAEVFEARHKLLGNNVALKVLKCGAMDSKALERFKREAQIISSLNHPGIVRLLDYGVTDDGRPFIVMEMLHGQTLEELLSSGKRLSAAECISLFSELCAALAYAHKAGVVHRDLKPGNIIVEDNGKERSLKVVDFGLASSVDIDADTHNRLTQTGHVVGTPYYMSPEQCHGHRPDERSDVYSLACVMYESLCGKLPFPGPSLFDVMRQHIEEPPLPLAKQSPDLKNETALERVILKCLAKDADDRFQSMDEMRNALLNVEKRKGKSLDFWHDFGVQARASKRKRNTLIGRVFWGVGGAALVAIMLPMLLESIDQNADAKWTRYNKQGQEALNSGRYHDASVFYGMAAKLSASFAHDMDKQQWQERYRAALERERLAAHLEGARGNESTVGQELIAFQQDWEKAAKDKDQLLLQLWRAYPETPTAEQRAQFVPLAMRVLEMAHRYCDDKRFDEAMALCNETLTKSGQILGDKNLVSGQALYEKGRVLNGLHEWSKAEDLVRQGVSMLMELGGPNSVETGKAEYHLAIALLNQKKNEEAQEWLNKAIANYKKNNFDDGLAYALEAQGSIYGNEKQYDAALDLYRQAMALQQKNRNYEAWRQCVEQICWLYRMKHQVAEGERFLDTMLTELVNNGRNSDVDRAYLHLMMGRFQEEQGKLPSAARHYKDAVLIYQNYFAPSDKQLIEAVSDFARAAAKSGNDSEAQRFYAELHGMNQIIRGSESGDGQNHL